MNRTPGPVITMTSRIALVLGLLSAGSGAALAQEPPPANDDFASATTITTLPYRSPRTPNFFATDEAGEPRPCGGISRTIWFRFTPTTDVTLVADTSNSSLGVVLAAYTGPSLDALTPLGCHSPGGPFAELVIEAEAGVTQHFQVGGQNGSAGSIQFDLVAAPPLATEPGTTSRASVASGGGQGDSAGTTGAISADGRHVAFASFSTNMVPGDTNARTDIFVHNRLAGTTSRVSVASNGAQANGAGALPSISVTGRHVAFQSSATNLASADTNAVVDVFVHDRDADGDGVLDEPGGISTTRVSVASDGMQANGASINAAVSGDGRHVAFQSTATNLVSLDTNNAPDVFVHDRDADGDGILDEPGGVTTTRVSVSSVGTQAVGFSERPAISADGRHVAFDSTSSTLVANDRNNWSDVFVHDRDADGDGAFDELAAVQTTRVSLSSSGAEGNSISEDASISATGRYVAFRSFSSNFAAGDSNEQFDIFVTDRDADVDGVFDESGAIATSIVSVGPDGTAANNWSFNPVISGDGRYVAFDSRASTLAVGDVNGLSDVFLHDRFTRTTLVATSDLRDRVANGPSTVPSLSFDGSIVTFESSATDLVAGDTNGRIDVFLRQRGVRFPTDIKPGEDPNLVHPGTKALVDVAVPGTAGLDATTVDSRSACFGEAEDPSERDCTETHGKGHLEDVNGDGTLDLLLHFETDQTGIDVGDLRACLTATTTSGLTFESCDWITTVPGG